MGSWWYNSIMVELGADSSRHPAPDGFLGLLYVTFLSVVSAVLIVVSVPGAIRTRLANR